MFLKSIFKTSEGFLTALVTVGSIFLPNVPWEAFGAVGVYALGRSWVKAMNGTPK